MANIIEITHFDDPLLDIYARLNERQLFTYREPDLGIFIAESPNVIHRALAAGYEPVSMLMEKKDVCHVDERIQNEYPDLPIYVADNAVLSQLTGFSLTRGMLCAMNRREMPSIDSILKTANRIAVLEEVVNPTNVGAIIRSAAAMHMDAVILSSGCADPLYKRAARVSMGCVFQIPWIKLEDQDWPKKTIDLLHENGFCTAAMALSDKSISIDDPKLLKEDKLAVVLGTEGEGLLEETISLCRETVKIPMSHDVDSLNVAAASAVAFWELRKR